ncbi:unnamed protein product [Didymodactylos carnosus]|uniref:B box-type domain-containing protein n=1 Tax=Didymodactylos carnosus TaxID=1234261 RepID=A0A815H7M0_9BILA|nr:unnamed protein product [Didymodactylos carnosus]CAF1347818.1 unnamed protein product [Didymodactylos carnosus]CAF3775262.1 unnamed protein product [Didymodactylos carnosus]CAF4215147.1 unnamed protein product [Didymodactylos carnosus]
MDVATKELCATCGQSAEYFGCSGCNQSFCNNHIGSHRQELAKELNHVECKYDMLLQEIREPYVEQHSLISKINNWEQHSICFIQQAAETARRELQDLLQKNKDEVITEVHKLTQKLRLAREIDDYSEIDLQKWTDQLNQLKHQLTSPLHIIIATPSINEISVTSLQKGTLVVFILTKDEITC